MDCYGRFSGNKWSSSTKRMLDLAFYKVTPLFFLMPRIRLYEMLIHLIYLKTSVLYKMFVGKYVPERRHFSTKWGVARSIFFTFWGPKTLLYRGSAQPLKVVEIGTPIQKWSEPGVFCTFWVRNVVRATPACNFSTHWTIKGRTP